MNSRPVPRILAVLLLCCGIAGACAALDLGPHVMVTGTTMEPEVLMKGDTGVLAIDLVNAGDQAVTLNSARLTGVEVTTMENPYATETVLEPGGTTTFTYHVKADASDGIYYMRFAADFREGGTLRYSVPVQIESTTVKVSLLEAPDPLAQGVRGDFVVMVGNPRPNTVNAVTLSPEGEGFVVTPSSFFIGTLGPDEYRVVIFNVTPLKQSFIRFRANYKNGITPHTVTSTLPLAPTENRVLAEPVLSNLRISAEPGILHLTGDVTNIGLAVARSVTLTTGGDATPADPYRVYAVGTLEPDDLAGFEVTFKTKGQVAQVPVIVSWRDQAGNPYSETTLVDFNRDALSQAAGEPSRFLILLVWMLVIVVAAVIIYSWRRG